MLRYFLLLLITISTFVSGDVWDKYEVDGMQVLSVTGGHDINAYDKVVVLLHGGAMAGSDWKQQYRDSWFGDLSGIKYVFPTSTLPYHSGRGYVWYYDDVKDYNWDLENDAAYNITSIEEMASKVKNLIMFEMNQFRIGNNGTKVYLGGYSQGAQMAAYVQIRKLEFALGGVIVMDGFPLPPLCHMAGAPRKEARHNASYYGNDMNWFFWHGRDDSCFPVKWALDLYEGMMTSLGAAETIQYVHVEPGAKHWIYQNEFVDMVKFIRGGYLSNISGVTAKRSTTDHI